MDEGNVFVIDDNQRDIRFIKEVIKDSDLEATIHSANTKDEALSFVHQRNGYEDAPKPDVVMLDWNLIQATGSEVLEATKSVCSHIPVVVMTGSKTELNEIKPTLPQADRYTKKPTQPVGYIKLLCPYLPGQ